MRLFHLARELGMSVAELLARVPASEIVEWFEFTAAEEYAIGFQQFKAAKK